MTTDNGLNTNSATRDDSGASPVHLLLAACAVGAIVGIAFIIVQPWFGMSTLTSRHAAAYQELGNWSAAPAVIIAWMAHLAVSVFYGFISGLVILKYRSLGIISLFTLAFSWTTTLIAPPANALIVQLVSFQQIRPELLPGLNFLLDAKFFLHLLFFVAIVAVLSVYRNKLGQGEGNARLSEVTG